VNRIRTHGIRTVVNLRGCCADFDWYLDEARATCDQDIAQEDITLSANRLPPPDELRRLIDVIDRAEYPLVIHCRQGVDRTGLAAVAILLLTTDTPYAEARKQLGLRYGHVPFGPTRAMTRFFELYEQWLTAHGIAHTRQAFRQWAYHEYCPGRCRGSLELLEPVTASGAAREIEFPAGEALAVRVRATNLSPEVWRLRPGTGTGVHVRFMVFDQALTVVQVERAGLFAADVSPGGTIDLTLAVAPLHRPGTYRFVADLLDGQQFSFSQYGMEPLTLDLDVTSRE
jgi:Tyrosine phosphatase family